MANTTMYLPVAIGEWTECDLVAALTAPPTSFNPDCGTMFEKPSIP